MPAFERAVVKALKTLPRGYWQRVDGLTYPQWFPGIRLWLLEMRGIIRSQKTDHMFRSQQGMKSYQLVRDRKSN